MRELWKKILHALEAGQAVELVSILASSGSTPRGAGAVMAVFSNGESAGTIGRSEERRVGKECRL